MAHSIVHWEIGGHDAERSRAFYADLFGWETAPAGPGFFLVAPPGGSGIGGGIMQVPAGASPYVTIYVQVEDSAAALSRAERLGGEVVEPPRPIPGVGFFALFRDLDGNLIGLLSPERPRV